MGTWEELTRIFRRAFLDEVMGQDELTIISSVIRLIIELTATYHTVFKGLQ